MREISPANDISADDFLKQYVPSKFHPLIKRIRNQKQKGTRPVPSSTLIDRSSLLSESIRGSLVDKIALLVDENLSGRSDMCVQFALLFDLALQHLGLPSRGVEGTAIYYADDKKIFQWNHAWVRVGDEVIDANVDILHENPKVPEAVRIAPYWGPITETPRDRMLREKHGCGLSQDTDVENIWWPDLLAFLDSE